MTTKQDAIKAGVERPDRNANLVRYKDNHPRMSWEAIGRVFKISKQRAYQIYQKEKANAK